MGPEEGRGEDKVYLIEKPRQSVMGQLVSSCQRKQIKFFLIINTQFREKIIRIINEQNDHQRS